MSRAVRTAGWFSGLVALLLVLRSMGDVLGGPPLTSLGGATRWIDREGPATASVSLVRSVAELWLWYLLVVSLLHALGSVVRFAGAARLADALAFAGTSRLVRTGLGAGLVASTTISIAPAGASSEGDEPGTAVMRPLDDGMTPGSEQPLPTPEPTHVAPRDIDRPAQLPSTPHLYTVEQGDSLWLIAESLLADAWHRAPTDGDVDPFWRALVETNRHRLVTGDPDLILPGQVFEVPAVPPPG